MASRLYEILEQQEDGRKKCIRNARLANLSATDNMSYNSIADLFLLKNTSEDILYVSDDTIMTTEQARNYLVDVKTIMENAEIIDGRYPIMLLLFDADEDTTKFYKELNTFHNGYSINIGQSFLTSDGSWYKDVSSSGIVHTWDKTKDIVGSDGKKYRYYILYGNSTTYSFSNSAYQLFLVRTPSTSGSGSLDSDTVKSRVRKCVMGNIKITSPTPADYDITGGSETLSAVSISKQGNGYVRNNFIKTFEVLDNFECVNKGIFIKDSSRCKSLQYLEIGKSNVLYIQCASLNNIVIDTSSQLYYCLLEGGTKEHIIRKILPHCVDGYALYLQDKCPKCNIEFNGSILYITSSFDGSLIAPNVTKTNALWSSIPELELPSLTSYNSYIGSNIQELSLPSISDLSISGLSGWSFLRKFHIPSTVTSTGKTLNFSGGFFLEDLTIPNNWDNNTNVSDCPLDHTHLVDIISALKDNSDTGNTRTLTLGSTNLAKLTAEEIAIATNKGWTVS